MFKIKKMITVVGLILFGILLMISFSGANPVGQTRPVPPVPIVKIDSNVVIPRMFLEKALEDSLDKLDNLRKSNDSVFKVRKWKYNKIHKLISELVHKRKVTVIKDTVYLPSHFAFDSSLNNNDFNYLIHLN